MICEDIDMHNECASISKKDDQLVRRTLVRPLAVIAVLIILGIESQAATLTITANHGSVTATPQKAQYDIGENFLIFSAIMINTGEYSIPFFPNSPIQTASGAS